MRLKDEGEGEGEDEGEDEDAAELLRLICRELNYW
jgi:hypothetical protein